MTDRNERPLRFSQITKEQREAAALEYRRNVTQPARDELTIRGLDPDTPEGEITKQALIDTFFDYDPDDNPDLPPVAEGTLTMGNVANVVLGELTDDQDTSGTVVADIFDPYAQETMRTMFQENVDAANELL